MTSYTHAQYVAELIPSLEAAGSALAFCETCEEGENDQGPFFQARVDDFKAKLAAAQRVQSDKDVTSKDLDDMRSFLEVTIKDAQDNLFNMQGRADQLNALKGAMREKRKDLIAVANAELESAQQQVQQTKEKLAALSTWVQRVDREEFAKRAEAEAAVSAVKK